MTEYTTPLPELLKRYGVDPALGLSGEQAAKQLEAFGENRLQEQKRPGVLQRFFMQLRDPMVLILIAAAVISFVVALLEGHGEFIDSIIIIAIVLLNATLGVVQESRAEHALEALQKLSAPVAKVRRDGRVAEIPSSLVVPGDIVQLDAGDLIPADGRILESASLQCEESALTGESVPAEKDASYLPEENAPLGDRRNMVYTGCSAVYGRASVLVTGTGMQTEMGKIAGLLSGTGAEMTPLQQKLARLGGQLGLIAVIVCAAVFGIGLLRGMDTITIFMTAVSLAVAAIPEGMAAVVTVVLALGVQKMVAHGAIIRRLPAVETLGSASVICSDKTGTLTQNRMTVQQVWAAGSEPEEMSEALSEAALQVVRMGTLCNDGRLEPGEEGFRHIGDPTETAVVAAALANGIDKIELDKRCPRIAELPFDSDRKLMTTVHRAGDKVIAVTKGGFDVLLPLCKGADTGRAREVNLAMGRQALRVLAVACRELPEAPREVSFGALERGLTFLGLIGMIDPPREESKAAVTTCRRAGIKTVMITGDHVVTAAAIAKELDILREESEAISGAELAQLDERQLAERVDRYSVYARVSPEDKIRIVRAWQERGAVVSMTGDGVNDAPALRAADIGCAMGVTGTDVAKGAADMVLTDDNFSTIVEAVRQGRGIFDNIRKTVQFLLSCNLGEIIVVLMAILLGWGAPLLAIHLLLINVVTDTLPALALGVEPPDTDIMRRSPVPREQGIFTPRMIWTIGLQGALIGVITLLGYYIGCFVQISQYFQPSHEIGMTLAFLILSLSQLSQALTCRSRHSLFTIGFFSNKSMVRGILGSLFIVLLICLVPPLEQLFKISDISMLHWILVACLSAVPLLLSEIAKAIPSMNM